MKAAAFDYVRPATLEAALALLAEHGEAARPVAGGQSLIPAMNLRLSAPALLIDIVRLPELRGIVCRDNVLRLGALTRHAELLTSPAIAKAAPLLARAAAQIAHPAIRSRGTLGGSLAHADPAAELPACILALDARLHVASVRGRRVVPAGSFFTGLFATALAPDEMLVSIEIDVPSGPCGFGELTRRSGDYAMIGLAAQAFLQGETRLAFFSAGATPILAGRAATALASGDLDAAALALAEDLPDHSDLQASAAARLYLARVLFRRVTRELGVGA